MSPKFQPKLQDSNQPDPMVEKIAKVLLNFVSDRTKSSLLPSDVEPAVIEAKQVIPVETLREIDSSRERVASLLAFSDSMQQDVLGKYVYLRSLMLVALA